MWTIKNNERSERNLKKGFSLGASRSVAVDWCVSSHQDPADGLEKTARRPEGNEGYIKAEVVKDRTGNVGKDEGKPANQTEEYNEEYNNEVFSIAKDRALQRYPPENVRDSYRILDLERINGCKQMPYIFKKRNMCYGRTEANHLALAGRIRDIVSQGECIKIYFDGIISARYSFVPCW